MIFLYPKNNIGRHHSQSGLTLVELMIGLALGLLLAAIMGTMYLSSKVSYTSSTQVARTQENLRFASYYLQRDLREAAYTECGSESPIAIQLDTSDVNYIVEATSQGISGWDFDGTDIGETYNLAYQNIKPDSSEAAIVAAKAANAGSASDWDNAAGDDLPPILAGFNPLKGSDIVVFSSELKTDVTLTAPGSITVADLSVSAGDSSPVLGEILKVGTCNNLYKFQNTSCSSTTISTGTGAITGFNPGNNASYVTAPNPWNQAVPQESAVYAELLSIYYIGTGSSGLPSLFRYTSKCGLSALTSPCSEITNVELVEGVENMQILYGVDTDIGASKDDVANIYQSADSVTDFSNVVSLRVSLLMRSNEQSEQVDTQTYLMSDQIIVDPPDTGMIRYVSNMTLHLRNRGA